MKWEDFGSHWGRLACRLRKIRSWNIQMQLSSAAGDSVSDCEITSSAAPFVIAMARVAEWKFEEEITGLRNVDFWWILAQ